MSYIPMQQDGSKSLESLAAFLSGVKADPAQLEEVRSFFSYLRASSDSKSRLAWYQILFEFAPQGYLITNREGVILDANATAVEMFGIDLQSLVNMPLGLLLPENELVFDLFSDDEPAAAAHVSTFHVNLPFEAKPQQFEIHGCVAQGFDPYSQTKVFLWLLKIEGTAQSSLQLPIPTPLSRVAMYS